MGKRLDYVRDRFRYRITQNADAALWNRPMYQAVLRYQPPAYDGPLLMLEPAERLDIANMAESWAGIRQTRREIQRVSGKHECVLEEPMVAEIAAVIRRSLDDTQVHEVEERRAPIGRVQRTAGRG